MVDFIREFAKRRGQKLREESEKKAAESKPAPTESEAKPSGTEHRSTIEQIRQDRQAPERAESGLLGSDYGGRRS